MRKAELAARLSNLKTFSTPKEGLEQYPTDGETAAFLLWQAEMIDGLAGQRVLDLGAGTGVLGIGALMLEAAHVTFVEIDADALDDLQTNLEALGADESRSEVVHGGVQAFEADLVIMNPPWGARNAHADRPFLEAALRSAPVVYSIHTAGSASVIDELAAAHSATRTHTWQTLLPLRKQFSHHTANIRRVPALLVRIARQ